MHPIGKCNKINLNQQILFNPLAARLLRVVNCYGDWYVLYHEILVMLLIILQPSWRHLPHSSNYSMISYRGSDIKMDEDLGFVFFCFSFFEYITITYSTVSVYLSQACIEMSQWIELFFDRLPLAFRHCIERELPPAIWLFSHGPLSQTFATPHDCCKCCQLAQQLQDYDFELQLCSQNIAYYAAHTASERVLKVSLLFRSYDEKLCVLFLIATQHRFNVFKEWT